jgi:hypothetical protein
MDDFTATGGDAGTTDNSDLGNWADPPDEERFKRNYLCVAQDAGGASAAPEGEWSLISAYTPASYRLSHAAFTAVTASGDKCAIVKQNNFPLMKVDAAINRGLELLGEHIFTDSSLTLVTGQTEYNLPSNIRTVLSVEVPTNDDADDNQYIALDFSFIGPPRTLATETKLVIPGAEGYVGEAVLITYSGFHAKLTAYNSPLYRFISVDLAASAGVYALLLEYINSKSGSAKPHWNNMFVEAKRQMEEEKIVIPTPKIRVKRKPGLQWGARTD